MLLLADVGAVFLSVYSIIPVERKLQTLQLQLFCQIAKLVYFSLSFAVLVVVLFVSEGCRSKSRKYQIQN